MPGSLRLHCVHLCRAPALDLAGPELRAVVDAAASEDPCESGAAIAGCMPSPSPLPLSPSGMPPNTHRDPAGGGKGQAGPGRWTGGPVLLRAPPASPPQPWTGRNGGDDLSLPSSEPLHGGDPFTAETPSRGDPFTRRPLHAETPSRGDPFTAETPSRGDPFAAGSFLPPSLGCFCSSCLECPSRSRLPNPACSSGPISNDPASRKPLGVPTRNQGLPWWLSGKASACDAGATGNLGSIPGMGRSPGRGHGSPPQCSCLENPKDRGAWWATVCGVAELDTTEAT